MAFAGVGLGRLRSTALSSKEQTSCKPLPRSELPTACGSCSRSPFCLPRVLNLSTVYALGSHDYQGSHRSSEREIMALQGKAGRKASVRANLSFKGLGGPFCPGGTFLGAVLRKAGWVWSIRMGSLI